MSFILTTFLGYFRIYRYPQTRTYQWCLQTWPYLSRILGLASERVQKGAHEASLGPDCPSTVGWPSAIRFRVQQFLFQQGYEESSRYCCKVFNLAFVKKRMQAEDQLRVHFFSPISCLLVALLVLSGVSSTKEICSDAFIPEHSRGLILVSSTDCIF